MVEGGDRRGDGRFGVNPECWSRCGSALMCQMEKVLGVRVFLSRDSVDCLSSGPSVPVVCEHSVVFFARLARDVEGVE